MSITQRDALRAPHSFSDEQLRALALAQYSVALRHMYGISDNVSETTDPGPWSAPWDHVDALCDAASWPNENPVPAAPQPAVVSTARAPLALPRPAASERRMDGGDGPFTKQEFLDYYAWYYGEEVALTRWAAAASVGPPQQTTPSSTDGAPCQHKGVFSARPGDWDYGPAQHVDGLQPVFVDALKDFNDALHDIHRHDREAEALKRVSPVCMSRQTDINAKMRAADASNAQYTSCRTCRTSTATTARPRR